MKQLPNIPIDLSDSESIRQKIPEIKQIVGEKQQALQEAQADFETWHQLFDRLRLLAGLVVRIEENSGDPDDVSPEALDAVVGVVEEADNPIQPVGVQNALAQEGHSVAGREAVFHTLVAAARLGRLQRVQDRVFAPLGEAIEVLPMVAVPEAHLGLDGPEPQSKAEAVLRVLGSESDRSWSAQQAAAVMVQRGWIEEGEGELASLASTLSRLHAERKIHRPSRGQYQLGAPNGAG